MQIIEMDELCHIHGGVNLLIKAPLITAAITLAILYGQSYFESPTAVVLPEPDLNPTTPSNNWDNFLTVGLPDKKPPSRE